MQLEVAMRLEAQITLAAGAHSATGLGSRAAQGTPVDLHDWSAAS